MTIMIPAWVGGTLTPVEKLEAHQRGLKHKAISVFVLAGQRVLVQRRAMGKYHTPGLWANTCCTHPDWGEDPDDCALRRLNEELGIKNLPLEHRQLLEYRAEVGNGLIEHEVVDVYVGHADTSLHIRPNPSEVMDHAWVHIDDLNKQVSRQPERYTPWLKIYLSEYADAIFGADLKANA